MIPGLNYNTPESEEKLKQLLPEGFLPPRKALTPSTRLLIFFHSRSIIGWTFLTEGNVNSNIFRGMLVDFLQLLCGISTGISSRGVFARAL